MLVTIKTLTNVTFKIELNTTDTVSEKYNDKIKINNNNRIRQFKKKINFLFCLQKLR